ncbi:MAG: hypothetical protein ACOC3I_00075 [Verrucomicrobiota bacterium]
MSKATTIRLSEEVQQALDQLSTLERRPKNKLVNEAVAEYIVRKGESLSNDLHAMLEKVATYRRADPDFEQAIAEVAAAEVAHAHDDPTAGTPSAAGASPLTDDIRGLIHA